MRPNASSPSGPGYDSSWRLIVWVLAATSIVATFIATRSGPQVMSDSTSYVAIARHLADGGGYTDYTAEAQAHWPPGYGGILAVGEAVGIDAFTGAWILNALAFGAIVVLASALVRRHVRTRFASAVALLVIAWSPILLHAADTALADVVFSAQVLAFLLLIERAAWKTEMSWYWVGAAAVIAGSAYLTRYAGLALIPAGVVTLLLWSRGALRRRSIQAGTFALVASVPPALWTARNLWVLGSASDSGPPSGDNTVDLARALVSATSELFLPSAIPTPVRVLVLVVLVVSCWLAFRAATPSRSRTEPNAPVSLVPMAVLLVVYPSFLVVSRLLTGVAAPNTRFLAPLLAPLVVLAAVGLEALAGKLRPAHRTAAALLAAAALVYAVGVAGWFWSGSLRAGRAGRGYEADRWQESELIARVDQEVPRTKTQVVYSSRPNAVYWVSGRDPVKWFTLPEVVALGFAPSPSEFLRQLENDAVCDRVSYLAWFDVDGRLPDIPGVIARRVRLTTLERADDGTLYRLRLRDALDKGGPRSCA
jgi:4-amino-4-deoxy-L-arabinose transferase-like glycosyltransferase